MNKKQRKRCKKEYKECDKEELTQGVLFDFEREFTRIKNDLLKHLESMQEIIAEYNFGQSNEVYINKINEDLALAKLSINDLVDIEKLPEYKKLQKLADSIGGHINMMYGTPLLFWFNYIFSAPRVSVRYDPSHPKTDYLEYPEDFLHLPLSRIKPESFFSADFVSVDESNKYALHAVYKDNPNETAAQDFLRPLISSLLKSIFSKL